MSHASDVLADHERPDSSAPQSQSQSAGATAHAQISEAGRDSVRTRIMVIAGVVAAWVAVVGWRLWLVRDIITPAAHSDEDGYLLTARALAGGVGGATSDNPTFHRVGYSALLTPICCGTISPMPSRSTKPPR